MSSNEQQDGGYTVMTPSGGTFTVLTDDERDYWIDRARRYVSENHFQNVTDVQDVDRLLIMETMCWRWGLWLSQEHDYWGNGVDLEALKKNLFDYSKELRLLKKALGIDKATRDREKGEGVAEYIENLRLRAREFGVMREEQLTKAVTLFKELEALVTFHLKCDEEERRENHIEISDVIEWIVKVAIPEFNLIDEHFRSNSQRFWIREI